MNMEKQNNKNLNKESLPFSGQCDVAIDWACTHPDHREGSDCLDRSVGCSKHCVCCMGELAIPRGESAAS